MMARLFYVLVLAKTCNTPKYFDLSLSFILEKYILCHVNESFLHMSNLRRPVTDWLPITKKEVDMRGWGELDVILISGDAYVDHPAFGSAVIGRIIESEGFRVAIVPQPNW